MRIGEGPSQSTGEERDGYVVQFETHVEAAVTSKLLLLWLPGGALLRYYCLRTISKGWRDGMSGWGAMMAVMMAAMAAMERASTRETQEKGNQRHRERHQLPARHQRHRDQSLENPGHRAQSSVDSC